MKKTIALLLVIVAPMIASAQMRPLEVRSLGGRCGTTERRGEEDAAARR